MDGGTMEGGSKNTSAVKCVELGLGEEEGDGRDIKGGPLVPVGGSNRD